MSSILLLYLLDLESVNKKYIYIYYCSTPKPCIDTTGTVQFNRYTFPAHEKSLNIKMTTRFYMPDNASTIVYSYQGQQILEISNATGTPSVKDTKTPDLIWFTYPPYNRINSNYQFQMQISRCSADEHGRFVLKMEYDGLLIDNRTIQLGNYAQARQTRPNSGGVAEGHPIFDKRGLQ